MDFDDAPNIDDYEDLLEDLDEDRLQIDEPDIPSDLEDDHFPTPPVTQTQQNTRQSQQPQSDCQSQQVPKSIELQFTKLQDAASGAPAQTKRSLGSLLDDLISVPDINEDGAPKRQKTGSASTAVEDMEALLVMDKIRAYRKIPRVEQFGDESAPIRTAVTDERGGRPSRIHRRVPLNGAFQKLTYADGERFFLRVGGKAPQKVQNLVSSRSSLLSKPFTDLMVEARQMEERRIALRHERDVLDKLATWQVDSGADSGIESDDDSATSALWVERFQPRNYVDLLSGETINRGLLHWLKLWDKVVFGRDVVFKSDKEEQMNKPGGKFKPFVKKPPFELISELDSTHRPKQRVALLCGPPGLGKTTLAHVLARHAGYHPWEMNASDDRSVGAFRTALETATQMQPVLGRHPRPNCLIIDEIDGAPAPSIALLVSAVSDVSTSAKAKKSKSAVPSIQRPVICICNDLYSPALRPLRQIALVMHFPPTEPAKLSGRLQDICRVNGLDTDTGALLSLCEKTRNDIRACLGFLQFIRSRQDTLTLEQVQTSAVGEKDHHKGLFAAWNEIFNIPRPKRKHVISTDRQGARISGDGTSVAERFRNVADVLSSCGEYEKLAQGVFENYLTVKIKDASMKTVVRGAEWLCFGDELHAELQHSQNYVLLPYQLYPGVACHLLFGSVQRVRAVFPSADAQARQRATRVSNLLETLVADMSPRTRCFNNVSGLVRDVLPFLLHISQPNLRPVNSQLFSAREASELRRVLELMIAYNLTYRQQRDADGQFQYTLDPNIEEVVYLAGQERPQKTAPYTIKQLIAREIELEKIRRAETPTVRVEDPSRKQQLQPSKATTSPAHRTPAVHGTPSAPAHLSTSPAAATLPSGTPQGTAATPSTAATPALPTAADTNQVDTNTAAKDAVPNHLQKLKAKPIAKPDSENQAPRDFFGRKIEVLEKPVSAEQEEASEAGRLLRSDVWYHFKEGYNNAVRRTVRVKDLA